jgi:hypothetical protein
MKVAVVVIGWLAIGHLGIWMAWWMVTLTSTAPSATLTVTLGMVLLLAWISGTLLVWRHVWLAALVFASAAALPLTPEHALPQPFLLVAISASLAIGSGLAGVATPREKPRRPQVHPVGKPANVEAHRIPLGCCLICLEPTETTICTACTKALGPQVALWLPEAGRDPVFRGGTVALTSRG